MQSNSSSHSLQLWFSRVGDESTSIEQQVKHLLSSSEKERLQSTKSSHKRREFLLSRALMRHALSHSFPIKENKWEFIDRSEYLPEIKNLPKDTFLSLSHSNGFICFAIADSPIGIDLEVIEQRNFYDLAEMFMDEEELDHLAKSTDNQTEFFYRTWCAKEAYYKMLPLSEQTSTDFKDLSISELMNNEKEPFLMEWEFDQYMLAVVMEDRPDNIRHHHFPSSFKLPTLIFK